jgi:hypothetical protein
MPNASAALGEPRAGGFLPTLVYDQPNRTSRSGLTPSCDGRVVVVTGERVPPRPTLAGSVVCRVIGAVDDEDVDRDLEESSVPSIAHTMVIARSRDREEGKNHVATAVALHRPRGDR